MPRHGVMLYGLGRPRAGPTRPMPESRAAVRVFLPSLPFLCSNFSFLHFFILPPKDEEKRHKRGSTLMLRAPGSAFANPRAPGSRGRCAPHRCVCNPLRPFNPPFPS